jgi:hypothetical protein
MLGAPPVTLPVPSNQFSGGDDEAVAAEVAVQTLLYQQKQVLNCRQENNSYVDVSYQRWNIDCIRLFGMPDHAARKSIVTLI